MHNPKKTTPFPPKIKRGMPQWLQAFYLNSYLEKNLLKKP